MNGPTAHSLCDAILGLSAQADDIFETVGALLGLLVNAKALVGNDVDDDLRRLREQYTVALANAEARAEGLRLSLRAVAAQRQELEESYVNLHRVRKLGSQL